MAFLSRRGLAAAMVAGAALLSAGCPYVAEGEIRAAEGSLTVGPGSVVQLALYCDRLFAGWALAAGGARCGGAWAISDPACSAFDCPPAADPALGTITACGVYTAPAERPPVTPVVHATECDTFQCFDACGASVPLDLAGYDPR